jgi:acid phosphatase
MPNYMASVGGEYFGVNHDNYQEVPQNVSTVVDLLDAAGISWGEYQEDMPYTGYTDFDYKNPVTKANMYVRKHK